MTLQNKANI